MKTAGKHAGGFEFALTGEQEIRRRIATEVNKVWPLFENLC